MLKINLYDYDMCLGMHMFVRHETIKVGKTVKGDTLFYFPGKRVRGLVMDQLINFCPACSHPFIESRIPNCNVPVTTIEFRDHCVDKGIDLPPMPKMFV